MSDSDLIGDARTIYRLLQTGQNRSAIERLTPFIDKADAKGRADHCARGVCAGAVTGAGGRDTGLI